MSKELATGIVITCLAVVVCTAVPMAGLIGSAFIPVPLIFFRAKLGRPAARVSALAALGCALLIGGPLEAFFFGELLLIGLAMGLDAAGLGVQLNLAFDGTLKRGITAAA